MPRSSAFCGADGCLLLQAGKQMEWLTGGHVKAGMHEVINASGMADPLQCAHSAQICTISKSCAASLLHDAVGVHVAVFMLWVNSPEM